MEIQVHQHRLLAGFLRLPFNKMTYTQHPLSAAFPAMSADDFQALVDDIDNNGQRDPVMIFEGMVLDGWHRYSACMSLGMEPTKFEFKGEDPVAFVLSHNLHRRHLSGSQRAAAIVACSEWHPAHRTKKVEPSSTLPKTNKEIAKEAGVTVRTVTDAKTAQKAGLIDAVRDGALTAKEAAKVARGTPEKPSKPEAKPDAAKPVLTVVPVVKPEDEYTELDAAHDQIQELQAALVVANIGSADSDEAAQAANLIAELRAEIKTLQATLKAVKISRDGFQKQVAEMQMQINRQRREIDKATGSRTA